MKLYNTTVAPNPRRVRMFAAEKGLNIPLVTVDLGKGEQRRPEFLAKNPLGQLPVLELNDGTCICESLAICEYLEDLHPDPPLIGSTPEERAIARMWDRRIEFEVTLNLLHAFMHSSPYFEGKRIQIAAYAEACRDLAAERLRWLDLEVAERDYIAGDRFTIADITLFCTLEFAGMVGEDYDADALEHLARWQASVATRPSARA